MKKNIIYFFAGALLLASCKKEEKPVTTGVNAPAIPTIKQPTNEELPESSRKLTAISFSEMEHDFGKIQQGDKVKHIFKFTNTGKNDLYISRAMGSCGCTIPEYPKEAIAPGKSGEMLVSFNSSGKTGPQHKTVTVYANIEGGVTILNIQANVLTEK